RYGYRPRLACLFRRRAETNFLCELLPWPLAKSREKSAIARTRSPARETRALRSTLHITFHDDNTSLCYKNIGGRDKAFINRVRAIAEETRRANPKRQMNVIQP